MSQFVLRELPHWTGKAVDSYSSSFIVTNTQQGGMNWHCIMHHNSILSRRSLSLNVIIINMGFGSSMSVIVSVGGNKLQVM